MSRRNEIKKDIWKILQEVYCFSDHVEITDRQNEFLDKVVQYLDANLSLRRKTDKTKEAEEDDTPLERPVASPRPAYDYKKYKRLKAASSDEETITVAPVKAEPKSEPKTSAAAVKASIDLNALPAHLRKYVKA